MAYSDPIKLLQDKYDQAVAELDQRITHKERGFDVYDKLIRNYIDPQLWPFQARVPDGRAASLLKRKTDRLIASKLQGKFIPRKYGTELGARVLTELELFRFQEIDMRTDKPMILRLRALDYRTRKYGSSFGLCTWKNTRRYEGPYYETLNNRDVLLQPGVTSIEDSDWVIIRQYVSIRELKEINKNSKTGNIFDDEALDSLIEQDKRDNNYTSVNKSVIGLSNTEGEGRIELCTYFSRDKFCYFVPKQPKAKVKKLQKEGMILAEFKNPHSHGEIPIVRNVYDEVEDDIYGVPDLEPVVPLIKTGWALFSQFLETVQDDLYTPLMVNPSQVQLDTLNYEPGARWLMNRPGEDVVPLSRTGNSTTAQFREVYGLITSMIMEGMGETAQDVSTVTQTLADKTATEVKDQALMRTARDNANKLMLSQTISRIVWFFSKMDQQFLSGEKLVRIVGKDALQYLINEGLHNWTINEKGAQIVADVATEQEVPFEAAFEIAKANGLLDEHVTPLNPGMNQEAPQLMLDKDQKGGFLSVGKKHIEGDYDFITDIQAMSMPNEQQELSGRQLLFEAFQKTEPQLQQQGYQIKWKDVLEKIGESATVKDVDQFIEKLPQSMPMGGGMVPPQGGQNAVIPTGNPAPNTGAPSVGIPQ